ncbi:MAG: hypothetical protein GY742_22495 [Hyphomicrobiales bacterium]|nr:hypothetical protein [Hyphomicrobiales bacterium]
MADGDTNSRALLNRRRALQVSAGAVFSAPTVISLAKTPAYAACASEPIVIDDFSHSQAAFTEISHPSFLFTTRYLDHGTTFSLGSLTMDYPANSANYPRVTWGQGMVGDLVGCTQLVLQNVHNLAGQVEARLANTAFWSGVVGVESGTELIFDITNISPLIKATPNFLTFRFVESGPEAKYLSSGGPLIAR